MFSRYFGDRYFAMRFWPNAGDVIVFVYPSAYVRVTVPARVRRVVVPPDEHGIIVPAEPKRIVR